MKEKAIKLLQNKSKTVPILSFPSTQLLGITVKQLVTCADRQVEGMIAIKNNFAVGAALNMMDLSVEAEAFGAEVKYFENEIPTVKKGIINSIEQVYDITVPDLDKGRAKIYIDAVKKAKEKIIDVPVFCGVIGPYSLACRLFDMAELMMECFDSPDEVAELVNKATQYIISYIKAFKQAGADGVIMAEPAAGLLSPSLAEEFSTPYVQKIIKAVSDDNFLFCYHNCGESANDMLSSIGSLDADIIHLGNAIDLKRALSILPKDKIVMGNVNPVLLKSGTAEDVEAEVEKVYNSCKEHPNFMLSTGCDVPAAAKLENIKAYFDKVNKIYAQGNN